jgi:uncharacterized protein
MCDSPDIAAAVFVKTPGYSPVKTRLAAGIGLDDAARFHQLATRCLRDVLRACRESLARRGISLCPVWSVAEPEALGDPLWEDFPAIDQGRGDLGARLHRVYAELLREHRGVILLGADSPQLSPELVASAAEVLVQREPGFCLAPANDGGFSLLGGNRSIPESIWRAVPYSSSETARRLLEQLGPLGPIERLPELIDVDTLDDLNRILPGLNRAEVLPAQRQLADWIACRFAPREGPHG